MKNTKYSAIQIIIITAVLCLFCGNVSVHAEYELPYATYTYSRGDLIASPPAFIVKNNIALKDDKDVSLKYPTDFFVDKSGCLIVTDNGNNRIICYDSDFSVLWQIDSVYDGKEEISLFQPYSVFRDIKGHYYITDNGIPDENGNSTGLGRVIQLDENRKYIRTIGKPESKQFEDYMFYPQRMVVDAPGRMYVISKNINQGFIQFSKEGEFEGFIGAPKVKTDLFELIIRFFSTKEQKKRLSAFVPVEYIGVDIDADNFIFATTTSLSQSVVNNLIYRQVNIGAINNSGNLEMVRKLNPAGEDILQRKGGFSPVGDIRYPNIALPGVPILDKEISRGTDAILGPSSLIDIKVVDGGIYFVLDGKRNRVFTYDSDSNLLFAFGSIGDTKNSFTDPVAIEYSKNNIYILNSKESTVSVCEPTSYGQQIISASTCQKNGQYAIAENLWKNILAQNSNCEQAYDALGKMYINTGEYKMAMEHFKLTGNRYYYSKALGYERSRFVEKYFLLVVLFLGIILFGVIKIFSYIKKLSLIGGRIGSIFEKVQYGIYTLTHPFKGFYSLKYENASSIWIATICFVLLGISSLLRSNASAFIFNFSDPRYFHIPAELTAVLLPYLLFIVSNWSLTTLMDGKGKFYDIYIYTGYAAIPLIMANFISFILSFVLTYSEAIILTTVNNFGTIWFVFLIFAGTIVIHEYSGKKAVLTLFLSLGGIVILVFIMMFFVSIVNNMTEFVKIIIKDLSFR